MRVLQASKFFYARGGLERVLLREIDLLERAGHEIAVFASAHPDNLGSPWSRFFAAYDELGDAGAGRSIWEKAGTLSRVIWSREAARRFEELVADFQPDVVHLHGIHRHISPSILGVTRRLHIPVVQTVHDFHYLCPNDVLLLAGREVCEPRRCRHHGYGAAVRNRCVKGSLSASAGAAIEAWVHDILGIYAASISRFIAPSLFSLRMLADAGIPGERLVHIKNPAPASGLPTARPEMSQAPTFLYAGRLSPEKGLPILLDSVSDSQGWSVRIAGDGPLAGELVSWLESKRGGGDVQLLGRIPDRALAEQRDQSWATVVPSVCYEISPMAILESLASGRAVVASAIGGIPEMIADGSDGVLVEPGDAVALGDALDSLARDRPAAVEMGRRAAEKAARDFSPQAHLDKLLRVYEEAVADGAA